jgi:hypothetical protein
MLPLGLMAIVLVLTHARSLRSDTRALNWECSEQASDFRSEASRLASGATAVTYTSHFNQQRHECLVEITSNRSEDGSVYDQIFDPKDETFIASRTRPARVRSSPDEEIVMGAPVPVQQESVARTWFNDLMTK